MHEPDPRYTAANVNRHSGEAFHIMPPRRRSLRSWALVILGGSLYFAGVIALCIGIAALIGGE